MIRRGARKVLNLALQGGGSHGAFAWGVLDRLLAGRPTRHQAEYSGHQGWCKLSRLPDQRTIMVRVCG
jgi:hypothetical protein